MYKRIGAVIEREINMENLKSMSTRINVLERSFCYRDFKKSAAYCLRQMKEHGFSGTRQIPVPADGKSTFMDRTIPQAWDVDDARLEIISPNIPESLLASLRDDALCVANRCAATPPGGVRAEVITMEQMQKVKDISGKMVLVRWMYPGKIIREVAAKNGLGIISCYSAGPLEVPDNSYWINGWGFPGWYHTREDRPLVCFSITPRRGAFLEELLREGPVRVRATVKSRTYDGSIYSVTGVIPGTEAAEILLYAHAYEPFMPDDAAGVAALLEIGRILSSLVRQKKIPPLCLGVRVVISQELYGFSHYFNSPENRRNILFGINMDSICHDCRKVGQSVRLRMSPASMPFFGDYLFKEISDYYLSDYPKCVENGNLSDDTFISDTTVGIPSQWPWIPPGKYHHNSHDSMDRMIDWNLARKMILAVGSYVATLAGADRRTILDLEQNAARAGQCEILNESNRLIAELRAGNLPFKTALDQFDFNLKWQRGRLASFRRYTREGDLAALDREITELGKRENKRLKACAKDDIPEPVLSRRDRLAQNMIIRRLGMGFPFSLARVPYESRIAHAAGTLQVFNWLDGKRTFYEALKLYQLEGGERLTDKEFSYWFKYLDLLAKYGYVSITYRKTLGKDDIRKGLRRLGVVKNDKVMVHCSFTSLGHVANGPETVCKALMELVTPQGVVMMPSFNHYGIVEPGEPGYYDPKKTPTKNGVVPDTFWKMKNVLRSLDPSHPFAAWGRDASEYVRNHHKLVTMGEGSPLHLLEQAGGKVILIDCPGANTFHHVVEMTNHVPCLGERTEEYPVKVPSGQMVKCRTWGWRDGGCPITDKGRFYEWMRSRKMIREGKIGEANVMVFKMKDFRRALEPYFYGKVKGFGCKKCPVRPRKVSATRPSDWDASKKSVRKDTTAFVADIS